MAKTFKKLNQLNNYINEKLEKSMDSVGKQVAKELRDYVFKNWYQSRGKPSDYNRTEQFLNSVTFQTMVSQGKVFTEVFFDPDLIDATIDEYSTWNQHMSVYKEDITEDLVGYIEYGQRSPLYSYDGIHMVKTTREWCQNNYKRLLVKEMQKYGIKLE